MECMCTVLLSCASVYLLRDSVVAVIYAGDALAMSEGNPLCVVSLFLCFTVLHFDGVAL